MERRGSVLRSLTALALLLGFAFGAAAATVEFRVVREDSIEYENGSFKEEVGDAAWAARAGTIPFVFYVKDANEVPMSFDYLRLQEIVGLTRVLLVADSTNRSITSDLTSWRVDLAAGAVGTTREFVWELRFADPFPKTNFYVNRVLVGQPLPSFSDWRRFDLHLHTFGTDTFFEWGAAIEFMAQAASAIGLDGFGVTDHGESLTDARWQIMTNDAAVHSNASRLVMRGIEANVDTDGDNDFPDYALHLTCHGLTRVLKTPAEYPSANQSGQLWTLDQLLDSLEVQNAVCFAAHPESETPILGSGSIFRWSDANYQTALTSPSFLGLEFYNQRTTVFEDTTPTEDNVNPYPTWQTDPDWPHQYDAGMVAYQTVAQGLLQAVNGDFATVRPLWFDGGADSHGDAAYKRHNLFGSFDLAVNDNAIGKIHTVLWMAGGLTEASALQAMRDGALIVSDGPLLVPTVRTGSGAILHVGRRVALPGDKTLVLTGASMDECGPFSDVFLIRVTTAAVDTFPLPVVGMTVNAEFPLSSFTHPTSGSFLIVEAHTTLNFRSVANPFIVSAFPATDVNDQQGQRLEVGPNPTQGEIEVRWTGARPSSIDLFTVNGRRVRTIVPDSPWLALPTDRLPAGVYLVRVVLPGRVVSEKVSIIR